MGFTDILATLATSKAEAIARKIKRSPESVKSAIKQGAEIIKQNPGELNIKGAQRIFKSMGVPAEFLDKAFSIASPFVSLVPGLNENEAKTTMNSIKSGMSSSATNNQSKSGFDRNKYKKI